MKNFMRVVTVEKAATGRKYLDTKAKCDWGILKKSPVFGEDLRFTLYNDEKMNMAFMLDIDHYGLIKKQKVINAARKVIRHKHYVVFSGRGFHVYIPILTPFGEEEYKYYKSSYNELTEEFKDALGEEVQMDSVFTHLKMGRVPGSRNSKGTKVRLVAEHDGPMAKGLEDVLEYEEVIETAGHTAPMPVPSTTPSKSPILNNCGFLQWARDEESLGYEEWFKAVSIAKKANDLELAKHISQGEDYDEEEIKQVFDTPKEYHVTCKSVEKLMEGQGENPCLSCPLRPYGSSPNSITGKYPTPSFLRNFLKFKTVEVDTDEINRAGNPVKKKIYVEDPTRVEIDDLYHYYVNKNYNDTVYVPEKDSLYRYTGNKWEMLTPLSKVTPEVLQEVASSLKTKVIYSHKDASYMASMFKNKPLFKNVSLEQFDRDGYINFKNGALELATGEFLEDTKRLYFTSEVNTDYEEDAECPTFMRILEKHVPNLLEKKLLQVFLGLSISQYSNNSYERFLWIQGSPGSGKSTILEVFQILSNGSDVVAKLEENFEVSNSCQVDFTGKSLMWIDDFKISNKRLALSWEAFINRITTGKPMHIDPKHVQPFQATPTCTFVATSNQGPPFTGSDQGLLRRLRHLHLYTIVKEEDQERDIDIRLREELPGLANFALEGLRYWEKKGMPKESESEKINKDMLKEEVLDYIDDFVKNHIDWKEGAMDEKNMLYNMFCKIYGFSQDSYPKAMFTRRFKEKICSHFGKEIRDFVVKKDWFYRFKNITFREKDGK